jgi:Tfp pilus assembly protein PilF
MRQALAIFAGALFLLHPLQTESVAYVASRSEVLSVLFYYSALTVFIYSNRESMSLLRAIAVVAFFGLAIATKEHALTLPILILFTDFYWHRGGLRRNLALYGLLGLVCAAGAVGVAKILLRSNTAGFTMKDLSPLAYFFTQCRVVWIYIRMFFLPFGQNVDPDIPVSQGPFDGGAIFGLVAFVVLIAAVWIFRKRYPLAAYGVCVFLLLIAPTSSVIPIRDVLAERRVYLPFLGLILIVLDFLRRLEFRQVVGVSVAASLICAVLTYQRSEVWSSSLSLWKDTVAKSPHKTRPLFHLAFAQYQTSDCVTAAANFEKASLLGDPPDYRLLVDWGNALDCAGRENDAAKEYTAAIQLTPYLAEAYVGLSAVYGKQRRFDEALKMLNQAQAIDPGIAQIYLNRGGVYELLGNFTSALRDYQQALALEPANRTAQSAVRRLSR